MEMAELEDQKVSTAAEYNIKLQTLMAKIKVAKTESGEDDEQDGHRRAPMSPLSTLSDESPISPSDLVDLPTPTTLENGGEREHIAHLVAAAGNSGIVNTGLLTV